MSRFKNWGNMRTSALPKKHRLTTLLSVPLTVLLLVSATTSANAKADPPSFPGATPTILDEYVKSVGNTNLDNQKKLMDLKSWIMQLPGIDEAGYIDQVNDSMTLSTKLLWHGDSSLQGTVLEESLRRGITATVENRSQSLPEIKNAAEVLWAHEQDFEALGFKLASVVGVTAAPGPIVIQGSNKGQMRTEPGTEQVRDLATQVTGLPISVELGHEATPAFGRSTDSAPFYAGGYMRSSADGTVCSTGFSLSLGGVNRATTARHCSSVPYAARDNAATSYGTTQALSTDGAGRILSSAGGGRMFDGAWNDSTGYNKPVWGFADVSLGDGICTSGGNSGVHCNINVTSMYEYVNDGFGVFSTIRGEVNGPLGIAAMEGDSGGPVLVPYTNGYVGAAGMIQQIGQPRGGGPEGCGAAHDYDEGYSNTCSPVVLFSSMRTIANYSGASIVTG